MKLNQNQSILSRVKLRGRKDEQEDTQSSLYAFILRALWNLLSMTTGTVTSELERKIYKYMCLLSQEPIVIDP
jgi:hypothetical protein